jgi:phage anti-repressor protein
LKQRWQERYKGREDEEGDVSSYWITVRKRENPGSCKMKHKISLSGEIALEVAMDLS